MSGFADILRFSHNSRLATPRSLDCCMSTKSNVKFGIRRRNRPRVHGHPLLIVDTLYNETGLYLRNGAVKI